MARVPRTDSVISIPWDLSSEGHRTIGMLLGTLASPPLKVNDPKWQEARRVFTHAAIAERARLDPEWAGQPQPIVPAEIALPLNAQAVFERGMMRIESALVGVHVEMPRIFKALQDSGRIDPRKTPKALRSEASLNERIDKVLDHEVRWREHLVNLGRRPPARRLPDFTESASAQSNVRNRIIRPNRGGLHLAAGVALALDFQSKAVARHCRGNRNRWERLGLISYAEGNEGEERHYPMIRLAILLGTPELAILAFRAAEFLEEATASIVGRAKSSVLRVHFELT